MRRSVALLLLLAAFALTGCWNSPNEFMREPLFSPVGAGLLSEETAAIQGPQALVPQPPPSGPPPSLYVEPRITHVGDIVTVIIAINDKATLGNSTGRSQTTKDGLTIDYGFNNGSAASSSNQPAKILGDLSSTAATQGQGNIDRSEQIQVSVAAVVTRVLANGNLVISRIAGSARQLRAAPADGGRNRAAVRHLAQQHHRLRPYRRGPHLLRRPRPA